MTTPTTKTSDHLPVQDMGAAPATVTVAVVAQCVSQVLPLEKALMTAEDLSLKTRAELLAGIPEEYEPLAEWLNLHLEDGAEEIQAVDLSEDIMEVAAGAGLHLHEIPDWSEKQRESALGLIAELMIFHWGLQRQGLAEAARFMILAGLYSPEELRTFSKALHLAGYRVPEDAAKAWVLDGSVPDQAWYEVAAGVARAGVTTTLWSCETERGWYLWSILREAAGI